MLGPGVTSPKSRLSWGARPATLDSRVVPTLSSRARGRRPTASVGLGAARLSAAVSGVGEKLPVDDVADAPLEGPERFLLRLGFGQLACVVEVAGVIVGDLGEGRGVDGVVDLPVASGVEPVAGLGARGGFDGGGAVVAGVVPGGREPADVAAVSEDDRGADGTDAVDVGDRRLRRRRGWRRKCRVCLGCKARGES